MIQFEPIPTQPVPNDCSHVNIVFEPFNYTRAYSLHFYTKPILKRYLTKINNPSIT